MRTEIRNGVSEKGGAHQRRDRVVGSVVNSSEREKADAKLTCWTYRSLSLTDKRGCEKGRTRALCAGCAASAQEGRVALAAEEVSRGLKSAQARGVGALGRA